MIFKPFFFSVWYISINEPCITPPPFTSTSTAITKLQSTTIFRETVILSKTNGRTGRRITIPAIIIYNVYTGQGWQGVSSGTKVLGSLGYHYHDVFRYDGRFKMIDLYPSSLTSRPFMSSRFLPTLEQVSRTVQPPDPYPSDPFTITNDPRDTAVIARYLPLRTVSRRKDNGKIIRIRWRF